MSGKEENFLEQKAALAQIAMEILFSISLGFNPRKLKKD
jgi:hypothetical protein